jgi:hypothetical protein
MSGADVMTRTFTITCAAGVIRLAGQARGECSFTVTNTSSVPLRAHPTVVALDGRAAAWFAVSGEPVRDLAPGQTVQVTVVINPSGAPAGRYGFRLDVMPGEGGERSTGPEACVELTSEAAPLPPGRKAFPWWLLILALVLVGVVAIAVVAWVMFRSYGAALRAPLEHALQQPAQPAQPPAQAAVTGDAVKDLAEGWLTAFRKKNAKALAALTDTPAVIGGKRAADARMVVELYNALLEQERTAATRLPTRSTTLGKPVSLRVRDLRTQLPPETKGLALADDDLAVAVTVEESGPKFVLLIRQGPPPRIVGVTR